MAQGVTSNRYLGGATGGQPSTGKNPFAKADAPGSHKKAIKKGKGGSTKKRQARPVR